MTEFYSTSSVTFYSDSQAISGNLYFPKSVENQSKFPGVVLCHGLAGIKECLLPNYAKEFAKNGIAALTFDYRGFGQSEGLRGYLIPTNQQRDIRNAITFLSTIGSIDTENIYLWGTSYGGANAIYVASQDTRVKKIVVQLTFGNGNRVLNHGKTEQEILKLKNILESTQKRAVTKNKNMFLAASEILSDEDAKEFFASSIPEFPEINIKMPITTLQETALYIPENEIGKLSIPIMIIGAEKDLSCPPEESLLLFERANNKKELVMIKNARHFDLYKGDCFNQSVDHAIRWYKSKV